MTNHLPDLIITSYNQKEAKYETNWGCYTHRMRGVGRELYKDNAQLGIISLQEVREKTEIRKGKSNGTEIFKNILSEMFKQDDIKGLKNKTIGLIVDKELEIIPELTTKVLLGVDDKITTMNLKPSKRRLLGVTVFNKSNPNWKFRIYSTHLSHARQGSQRAQQIDKLLDIIISEAKKFTKTEQLPPMLVGDINIKSANPDFESDFENLAKLEKYFTLINKEMDIKDHIWIGKTEEFQKVNTLIKGNFHILEKKELILNKAMIPNAALSGIPGSKDDNLFFYNDEYYNYSNSYQCLKSNSPRKIVDLFKNWPNNFNNIDACLVGRRKQKGNLFFFKSNEFITVDIHTFTVLGESRKIADHWNFPSNFTENIDAAVNGTGKKKNKAYFFKGEKYLRYDFENESVDKEYEPPRSLKKWNFDIAPEFYSNISAAWLDSEKSEVIYFIKEINDKPFYIKYKQGYGTVNPKRKIYSKYKDWFHRYTDHTVPRVYLKINL